MAYKLMRLYYKALVVNVEMRTLDKGKKKKKFQNAYIENYIYDVSCMVENLE